MTPDEKQSGIHCVLIGTDGNIFALLGRARQALKTGGREDLIEPMTEEVLQANLMRKPLDIFANMSKLNKKICEESRPPHKRAFFA